MNFQPDQILQKIKNLDPQTRYYVFGGGLVFVFLLNYLLILGPELKALNKIDTKISEITQSLQAVNNDILRIDQNKAQLERLRKQIQDVKVKIRTKQEVPFILEEISRIANLHSVKIDQLMPLKDQQSVLVNNPDVMYSSLPIMIQSRSSYHDLGRFLAQMEREGVFVTIGAFSIAGNPKDTANHTIQLTVKTVVAEPPPPVETKKK